MLVERSGDTDFPKVLDFGLARTVDNEALGRTPITQRDVIPGTPAYLPPERANGVSDDPRSDLYSLGALWFELLTGQPPFPGESSIKIILRHIHDTPVAPSRANPSAGIPPAIDALVLRLLEKLPERRPARAFDLLEEVDALNRPRGWHVSGAAKLAHHAASDDGLRGYTETLAALDELNFEVEHQAEEPIMLTRRKAMPPVSGVSMMIDKKPMPAPGPAPMPEPPGREPTSQPPQPTQSDVMHLLDRKKAKSSGETPLPQRVRISSVAEVSTHMANARTVRDVAELAVAFLATRFDRTFVVDFRTGVAAVQASLGINDIGGVPGAVARCQSLQEMLLRRDAYYGPAIASPDWLAFFRTLGGSLPGAVFVGALKREGRAAFFFYGDHRDLALKPDVKDAVVLMREAAAALSTAGD
jgi:hypothetical protein